MPSPSESELAATVIEHLADIAAGRCTISEQQIAEAAETDPVLAEIFTGLLFLHEDLALRADQRDRALAAAEAANRELEAFSYSVAHDLRAPLRSIDGFSQALLEDHWDALSSDGRNHLGRVRDSVQRMGELIDDLLQLSRVSRAELRRTRVDLSMLARSVFADFRKGEPDRRVDVEVEDGLITQADPRLVRIILENLLGNAWKFTAKAAHPKIEFRAREEAGEVVYLVRDNGAGFNMTYVSRLFGPFQRLHRERDFPGTGVGLATVQRIIHRHGGRVWAEGAVGCGATLYFTLPGHPAGPKRPE